VEGDAHREATGAGTQGLGERPRARDGLGQAGQAKKKPTDPPIAQSPVRRWRVRHLQILAPAPEGNRLSSQQTRNTTPQGGRAQRTISYCWSPSVCWRSMQTVSQKAPSTAFFSPIYFATPHIFPGFSNPHFILTRDNRQLETSFDNHRTFFSDSE
jgi:hypothetical protein